MAVTKITLIVINSFFNIVTSFEIKPPHFYYVVNQRKYLLLSLKSTILIRLQINERANQMRGIEVTDWQKREPIKKLVKAAFPNYRRKTVVILPDTSVTFQQLAWDGGCRNEYGLISISDGNVRGILEYGEGKTLTIEPGFVAIQSGTFMGKPALCHIYINPADLIKLLPDHTHVVKV